MRGKRWILRLTLGLVLAAAAGFAGWMLWPRPLAAAFDGSQPLDVLFITSWAEIDEEAHIARPQQEVARRDFPAGSPEGAALQEVLSRYSYHLCWDTLTGKSSLDHSGGSDVTISLLNDSGQELDLFGVSRVFIGGRIYRVGYWGNSRGPALCREVVACFGK